MELTSVNVKCLNLRFEKDGYFVDVRLVDDIYEFWMQRSEYGVSMFMFGYSKKVMHFEEIIVFAEGEFEEYKELYMNQYKDEVKERNYSSDAFNI